MLSKAKIKFIKSLQIKKYRKQEQCFLVEGAKSVHELLDSDFELVTLLGTSDFLSGLNRSIKCEVIEVSVKELEGLGDFQTNDTTLAIARQRLNNPIDVLPDEFALVLDDIKDPGNLGTIIRTADWFGIQKIIASAETADFYNSKVITSSMGSFTRTRIFYTDLEEFLSKNRLKVFGAYLSGSDVHKTDFGTGGLIVMGNESKGISPSLEKYITDKITIPRYGKAESLNAAIATAIICDNIRR
ncbi:MAG TPA: RNA methyltransferase [Chryseolinea sp.]|nr:RNA methyltransferase [Chryseolinea sp.]HPM31738.1 RNA methyltransferase [Chryseolinea sp.]